MHRGELHCSSLLRDLVRERYEANWLCCIASHATEHAAELDRPTLQRLLALPGDLWLAQVDEHKQGAYFALQ